METIILFLGVALLSFLLVAALRGIITVGHINYSYYRLERDARLSSTEALKQLVYKN